MEAVTANQLSVFPYLYLYFPHVSSILTVDALSPLVLTADHRPTVFAY